MLRKEKRVGRAPITAKASPFAPKHVKIPSPLTSGNPCKALAGSRAPHLLQVHKLPIGAFEEGVLLHLLRAAGQSRTKRWSKPTTTRATEKNLFSSLTQPSM